VSAPGKVGLDMFAYHNTGTYAAPIWAPIDICRDVTLDMTKGEADLSLRGSKWRRRRGTLKEGSISMELLYSPGNASYDAIADAFTNDTIMDIALADGLITTPGTNYFRADVEVFGFTRNEPLEDAVTVSSTMNVAASVNEPTFVTVP
jgi:Phage tail tube protein